MNYKRRLDRGEDEQVHVDAPFVNLSAVVIAELEQARLPSKLIGEARENDEWEDTEDGGSESFFPPTHPVSGP